MSSTQLKDSLGSDSVRRVPEPASTLCEFTSNGNRRAFWELWNSDRVSSTNRLGGKSDLIVTLYYNTTDLVD